MTFLTTLAQSAHLILDGATGTELNRRGVDTGLPLWSANALMNERDARILQDIHEDYLRAGADIISTNSRLKNHPDLLHKTLPKMVTSPADEIFTTLLGAPIFGRVRSSRQR